MKRPASVYHSSSQSLEIIAGRRSQKKENLDAASRMVDSQNSLNFLIDIKNLENSYNLYYYDHN